MSIRETVAILALAGTAHSLPERVKDLEDAVSAETTFRKASISVLNDDVASNSEAIKKLKTKVDALERSLESEGLYSSSNLAPPHQPVLEHFNGVDRNVDELRQRLLNLELEIKYPVR